MAELETATLAAGCFWCVEAVFDDLIGVEDVVSGYSGGHKDNPTYQEVCSETTGHAEVAQIKFDPDRLSFGDLLRVYFTVHDPTTLNRQGGDVGTSYRSAIFYHSPEQKATAEAVIKEITDAGIYDNPIVTVRQILASRRLPSGVFRQQSEPAVLCCGRCSESRKIP